MDDPYTQAAMIAAPYAQLGQQMFQGANMREAGYQKQMLQNAQRGAFEGHANAYNAQAQKLQSEARMNEQELNARTPESIGKLASVFAGLNDPQAREMQAYQQNGNWGVNPGYSLPPEQEGPESPETPKQAPTWYSPEVQGKFNAGRLAGMLNVGATGKSDTKQLLEAMLLGNAAGTSPQALNTHQSAMKGDLYNFQEFGTGDNSTGKVAFNQPYLDKNRSEVGKNNAASAKEYAHAGSFKADAELKRSKIGQAETVTMPDGTTVVSGAKPTAAQAAQSVKAQEKISDAKDVLSLLNLATPLIDVATGSYAGTGLDELGRVVGYGTDGAGNAAQLKAIEGALISKMPKMSGPQSDKDVLLYKQMAGQIGDSTIPPKTKKAAMVAIKNINDRYSGTKQVETTAEQPKQYTRTGVLNGRKVGLLADGRTVYQDTGEEAK